MRTTITIDDALYDKACAAAGDNNASILVTRALKLLVARDSKLRILRLSGSMPNLSIPNRGDSIDYADDHDGSQAPMVAEDSPE